MLKEMCWKNIKYIMNNILVYMIYVIVSVVEMFQVVTDLYVKALDISLVFILL